MSVLVDSSVWIEFFRGTEQTEKLGYLISEDLVVTNDLILAELIPALRLHRKLKHIRLIRTIYRHPLKINWPELIEMQVICLRQGINKVGIPDLIIAQHAIQNDMQLFSFDRHFKLLSKHLPLQLYQF